MIKSVRLFFQLLCFLLIVSSSTLQAREFTIFFHNDVLGSPIIGTDEAGNVLGKENYSPFGERQIKDPAASGNTLWFAGKPQNESSGLSYFNARYYSPELGQFMSVDPVAPLEGNIYNFNRYAYANNNPYKYIDPDGRIPIDTVWDGANVLYDIGKITAGWAFGNEVWVANGTIDLGLDAAALFIPYVPAGITKLRYADDVVDTTKGETTTVGRWMSKSEHQKMLDSGKVIESRTGTTHVANPADASAFIKQAKPGSRYVEFDVPASSLKQTNQGWAKVIGPNSLEGRQAAIKGLSVPQMPNATNITHRANKLP